MRKYSSLTDSAVLHTFDNAITSEHRAIASIVACILEVDERKLYLAAGFDSTLAYCVARRMSKHCAFKRIHAARAASRFPALLAGLEDDSLSVAAINLLAPHLTEGNAAELIESARKQPCEEIEALLAARFPRSEFLALGEVTPGLASDTQLAARRVHAANSLQDKPGSSEPSAGHARVTPVAADRDLLNLPIRRATTAKLKHAAELMSHTVPTGDMAEVLDRALDLAIAELERRKCAKTRAPRPRRSRSRDPRHVPAHVRRAVWERDQLQCTFVGEGGHRCECRTRLELDHIVPVARGGEATVANLRLRCRAHNQFEAERVFGAGFMRAKRERARGVDVSQVRSPQTPAECLVANADPGSDLALCLRSLGFRMDEIRRAVESCPATPDTTLEQRVRAALNLLKPQARTTTAAWRRRPRARSREVPSPRAFERRRRVSGDVAAPLC